MTTTDLSANDFEATVAEHEIVLVFSQPGALPGLEQLVTAIRELDVDAALAAAATQEIVTEERSA